MGRGLKAAQASFQFWNISFFDLSESLGVEKEVAKKRGGVEWILD